MLRIYVAGPLTQGDTLANIKVAINVATALLDAGHSPYLPHITIFWDLVTPRDYEVWMKLDFDWIEQCEALVRIPGYCPGCEREEEKARLLNIPVYQWNKDTKILLGVNDENN